MEAFLTLKNDLASASLECIRYDELFAIESDVSDYTIAAIFSQSGRPH